MTTAFMERQGMLARGKTPRVVSAPRQFLAVFAIALAARLVFVLWVPGYHEAVSLDSYSEVARNILQWGSLESPGALPSAYRVPGYSLFLACIYMFCGFKSQPVWMVQCLLSAVTAGLVALTARKYASVGLAWLAGLAAAAYLPFIYYSGRILSETLFTFLFVTALWLLSPGLRKISVKSAAVAGVVMGLACLTRPVLFYFPLGLAFLAFTLGIFRRERFWKAGIAMLCLFFLTLAPWGVRNWVRVGSPVLTSTEGGWSLWLGLHPDTQGFGYGNFHGVEQVYKRLEAQHGKINPFGIQAHRILMKESREEIVRDPKRFLRLAMVKVGWFFNVFDGEDYHLGTRYNLPAGLVVTFGFLGLLLGVRRSDAGLPIYSLLYFTAIAAVIYGIPRFRIPLEPVLILLGVIGLREIGGMAPRAKNAWAAVACALVLMNVALALGADAARDSIKGLLEHTVGYSEHFTG